AGMELATRRYGICEGGDRGARASLAPAGFILGNTSVEVPYIPGQAKWFPGLLLGLGRLYLFFSSRRRHTRLQGDWSSDVCSSDLILENLSRQLHHARRYQIYKAVGIQLCSSSI